MGKSRILLVDDDPGTVLVLSAVLEEMGEIYFARNGEDAIQMVNDAPPDVILLDAEMPGMSGFAVCRAIKSNPAFADLPVLFVTAHTGDEFEIAAFGAGAVDFITKPPTPPVVRARVRTHLTLKQRTDELHRLASIDGLTGVANRRTFDAALDREWHRAARGGTPLSLLLLDIDCFKTFNDHLGHQAGDDCLRLVAGALQAAVRRSGDLLARYGGEEFVAILPGSAAEEALAFAERLRAEVLAIAIAHPASTAADVVTISVGVATLDGDDTPRTGPHPGGATAADLVALADAGLYEAKRRGRNRCVLRRPDPPA